MKQQITVIFSVVVLLFIPFSFFAYADEEKYQNNSFGYSVNIPENYSITSPFNDIIILTAEKKNDANGIDNISILVTKNNDKQFSEMTQLVKNDIKNFGNEITDEIQIQLGNDDNIDELGNNHNKSILIKSHTAAINFPIFFENVVAYDENHAYFITLTYTDKSTQDDFHKMLESFEFAKDDFIPKWIKAISNGWANNDGVVSDEDYSNAIRYVISTSFSDKTTLEENNLNDNPSLLLDNNENKTIILPSWLKYPTSSWVNGEIDNESWKNLIGYLYENEIILI